MNLGYPSARLVWKATTVCWRQTTLYPLLAPSAITVLTGRRQLRNTRAHPALLTTELMLHLWLVGLSIVQLVGSSLTILFHYTILYYTILYYTIRFQNFKVVG